MKKIYLLLLFAFVGGMANAQMVHFYKYGQKVISVLMEDLDSITTLSAEEHPVTPYIEAELKSLTPNEKANNWTAEIDVKGIDVWSDSHDGYAFTEDSIPYEGVVFVPFWDIRNNPYQYRDVSIVEVGHTNPSTYRLTFTNLASDSTYHLKLRIEWPGVPFFASVDISTGHSLYDVLKETSCQTYIMVEGHMVGMTPDVLEAFLTKYQDVLGNDGPQYVQPTLADLVCSYLASLSYDQLSIASSVDFTGGTLALLATIPDGAIDYIKQTLYYDQPIVLSMDAYEIPVNSNMQPTMTDTLITCAPEWNAPWEKYVEVRALTSISHSEVIFETPTLLPSMKYDLYITMVSDSLPTWFQVNTIERKSNGDYSGRCTYYGNPNPVTVDSDVPNADVITSQSRSERCFPTGTKTCERILIQQGISSEYLSPMKFVIDSWGPSNSKYREKIYTRTLRIAGIELVPSAEATE